MTKSSLQPSLTAINSRYSELAQDEGCCLSCGGAVHYAQARAGEVCVDLGSGRGTDALRMASEVGAEGYVYGIDISDGMLDKARKTAQKLGIEHVEFQKAELENLPLKSESVDLLISNCVLNHAQDKQQVWREIFRVLKPNGRFVVSDIYASQEVPEQYQNDPAAVAECWAGADTRDVYFSTVQGAGFSQLDVLEESKPYPKGEIEVASMTLAGRKPAAKQKKCCCCSQ